MLRIMDINENNWKNNLFERTHLNFFSHNKSSSKIAIVLLSCTGGDADGKVNDLREYNIISCELSATLWIDIVCAIHLCFFFLNCYVCLRLL